MKQKQPLDFNKSLEKMSSSLTVMTWVGIVVGIIGLVLIASQNWLIAMGVFLAMWGNNLEQRVKTAKLELKKAQMQKDMLKNLGNLGNLFGSIQKEDINKENIN